jgi:hypothetical protein
MVRPCLIVWSSNSVSSTHVHCHVTWLNPGCRDARTNLTVFSVAESWMQLQPILLSYVSLIELNLYQIAIVYQYIYFHAVESLGCTLVGQFIGTRSTPRSRAKPSRTGAPSPDKRQGRGRRRAARPAGGAVAGRRFLPRSTTCREHLLCGLSTPVAYVSLRPCSP